MRALVPVAIVAIIAVTVLVIWLTARRREVRRDQLRLLTEANRRANDCLSDIRSETAAQISAGHTSHLYTAELIAQYFTSRGINS